MTLQVHDKRDWTPFVVRVSELSRLHHCPRQNHYSIKCFHPFVEPMLSLKLQQLTLKMQSLHRPWSIEASVVSNLEATDSLLLTTARFLSSDGGNPKFLIGFLQLPITLTGTNRSLPMYKLLTATTQFVRDYFRCMYFIHRINLHSFVLLGSTFC